MRPAVWIIALTVSMPGLGQANPPIDYVRDIKPILKSRCYACHGVLKQQAKLRLDSVAGLVQGGKHGPAVIRGKADDSPLMHRVTDPDEGSRMPPEGKPLTAEQVQLLRTWIDQGATGPADDRPETDPRQHWAFQKPVRPAIPDVKDLAWVRNPIDAFVAAEHERRGLVPNPSASRAVLLRRVYLDLIGLPPTRDELQAFLADSSPDAYESVVERLLASPRYGERWARHWMDVWRYSDWYGRRAVPDVMNSYPQIWRWRDWIVRSLNEDKGYDRMVQEMLAADELSPADDENVVATGFLVRNWFKWNYNQWMRDNVEHTGKAFLGLTMNCCHCHDHKYDPITQEEYFKFRAFFEPLELRHDRVSGQADPGPFRKYVYVESYGPISSGMIRVFDEKLDAKTFMYAGGDERNKIADRPPVSAGVPALLGGDRFKVEAVTLPPQAYYPALKPFIQQEETTKRRAAIQMARLELERAHQDLREATFQLGQVEAQPDATASTPPPRISDARSAARKRLQITEATLRLCELRSAASETDLISLRARIEADNARYPTPNGSAQQLALSASLADRRATLHAAQVKVAEAEIARLRASTDAALKQSEQQLAVARKALENAEKNLASDRADYTPLTPVYPQQSTGRRLALARWITSAENPLTARVAVNHIWSWHIGRPLVESTTDFGRNGKTPSHPQLLDWLAMELMAPSSANSSARPWSMKHIHRLIVTSNVYRQASHLTPRSEVSRTKDPDNIYLWRANVLRMHAEVVRDSLLHVAGTMDGTLGGPEIDHQAGLTNHRRSLYFSHHAEAKMVFLELFDAPNPCDAYRRTESILPQQALALTNSELSLEQSRRLASRLAVAALTDEQFIAAAFEQVLARSATPQEQAISTAFLQRQHSLFQSLEPRELRHGGATDASQRARENLLQSLFNHNDFVVVR